MELFSWEFYVYLVILKRNSEFQKINFYFEIWVSTLLAYHASEYWYSTGSRDVIISQMQETDVRVCSH